MRSLAAAVVLLGLGSACGAARAQEPARPPGEAPEAAQAHGWEFYAGVYGYFPHGNRNYGQPTVTAEHDALHLEARYNYEGIDTGSAWVGWNLGVGEKLRLDATLMAGGVFGETRGVAPGYRASLAWGPLELYSEGEWVFDLEDRDNDYFYNWAQLGYSPFDWLTVGFASQRTRAYETSLDIQRGPFIALTYKSVTLATYVFNADAEPPTVVTSLAVSF